MPIYYTVCSECGKAVLPEKAYYKVIEHEIITKMSEKDVAAFAKDYVLCQICFSVKFKDNVDSSMRSHVISVSVDESKFKKSRARAKTSSRSRRNKTYYPDTNTGRTPVSSNNNSK